MRSRARAALLLLCSISAALCIYAATPQPLNQQAIRHQLEHKFFLLRGRYVCPKPEESCTLVFNQQGQLQDKARIAPFSLSSIYVEKVVFSGQDLVLDAYGATIIRVSKSGLANIRKSPLLDTKVKLQIPIDASKPSALQDALHTIFAGNIQQVLNAEPPKKREADIASLPLLPHERPRKAARELKQVIGPAVHDLNISRQKGITPPVPIYSPEPRFTEQARADNVQGICRLMLIVNAQGFPQNIRVIRSLPDGLDESAIDAVSQYRFRPSTANGKPVPVRMVVEVDFHLT